MPVPTKANVKRPLSQGYDVLVEYGDQDSESLYLRAAVGPGRQMTFQTVEPQPKSPSTVENPEDMRSESGTTFSRSDFSGGEGLRRAHRREGTDADWTRFWSSEGVDVDILPSGDAGPLRLGRPMTLIESSFAADSVSLVHYHTGADDVLLVPGNNVVLRIGDVLTWTDSSTPASEDPHAGEGSQDVNDLVSLGDFVYAALGGSNGIHRRTRSGGVTGTWAHWSDLTGVTRLWGVKRRVIAAAGEDLYEAAASSGSTLLHTLAEGHTWVDVVDGGAVVLAAASNGIIYHFAEDEGELVLVGETTVEGETPTCLAATRGVILIGTTTAIYRAALVGQRIAQMQILKRFEAVRGTFGMAVGQDSIYVFRVRHVVSNSGIGEIWRYDLVTGGLFLYATVSGASDISVAPRRLIVVPTVGRLLLHYSGLRFESGTTYESSGYLISSLADFFNDDVKAWREVRLRLGAMPSGTSVSLAYSTDPAAIDNPSHTSWTTAINAVTTTGEHRADLIDVESRWIALKVTLATSNTANTPEVLSFAARGLLKPTEMDWQIPINVSDRLELPHRRPQLVPGLGEQVRDSMLGLVGKVATVTLLRPGEKVVGQIVGVSEPIQEIPERGSPSVYALLQIRGERQT